MKIRFTAKSGSHYLVVDEHHYRLDDKPNETPQGGVVGGVVELSLKASSQLVKGFIPFFTKVQTLLGLPLKSYLCYSS